MSNIGFRAGGLRAKLAIAAVSIHAAIVLAGSFFDVMLPGLAEGKSRAELEQLQTTYLGFAAANLLTLVVAGVVFLMWQSRAYRNLSALGASGLPRTVSNAAWGWFVPFYNLVHGHRVMKELWQASDPVVEDPDGYSRPWQTADVTPLLTVWWAAWIGTSVISRIDRVEGGALVAVDLLSSVLVAVAGVTVVLLMLGVEQRQAMLFSKLSEGPSVRDGLGHTPERPESSA